MRRTPRSPRLRPVCLTWAGKPPRASTQRWISAWSVVVVEEVARVLARFFVVAFLEVFEPTSLRVDEAFLMDAAFFEDAFFVEAEAFFVLDAFFVEEDAFFVLEAFFAEEAFFVEAAFFAEDAFFADVAFFA